MSESRRARRRAGLTLAATLAVVATLGLVGTGVEDHLHPTSLAISGTSSAHGEDLARQRFGDSSPIALLLRGPAGALERQGPRLVAALRRDRSVTVISPWDPAPGARKLPAPPAGASPGTPSHALVLLDFHVSLADAMRHTVPDLEATIAAHVHPPVEAIPSGFASISRALQSESLSAAERAELYAAPLLILVLLLVFRSVLAAAIPLVFGAMTVLAGRGVLVKTKLEPVTLNVQGKIAEVDGSHPPPLTEVVVDTDKNGTIDVRGVPPCKQGQLEARTTAAAEKICGPSILGTGTTDVEVLFQESQPVELHSKLLALSGGTKGGVTTIYIHAFLSTPVTAALVTTVKIKKENKGPYGLRSVATIPKIAGYSGSVTAFNLTFQKKLFSYKGKKHGYLLAKCANGRFLAQAEAKFHDGTTMGPAKITRACTPKG